MCNALGLLLFCIRFQSYFRIFFFNLEIDWHNFIWTKLQNWNFDIFNLVYVDAFNISAHIYKCVWSENKEINQGLS